MNAFDLDKLLKEERYREAVEQAYDSFDSLFFERGKAALSRPQTVIVAVGSFVGQMRDGGILAYMGSPWAEFANDVPSAFQETDLASYSAIADGLIKEFSSVEDSSEANWEEVEEPFWRHFYRSGDGDLPTIERQLGLYLTRCSG